MTQQNFIKYVEHDTLIWEYLNSSIHLVTEPHWTDLLIARHLTLRRSLRRSTRAMPTSNIVVPTTGFIHCRFYRLSDRQILNNALDTEKGSSDIDSAMRSFPQFYMSPPLMSSIFNNLSLIYL